MTRKVTIVEHLEELRIVIIKSLICIFITAIGVYAITDRILAWLIRPIGGKLIFLAPQEAFVATLKIALFGGCYLSSPYIFYQIWHFIKEGLYEKERGYFLYLGIFSFVAFIIGSSFGCFIMVPFAIKFLLGFGKGYIMPMISVDRYISFIMVFTFIFGMAFQLPLAMLLLSKIGIVTPDILSRNRKYAVLIIFIVAAIFTPPDVVSQFLLAVPLLVLYEISIIFCRVFSGKSLVCNKK